MRLILGSIGEKSCGTESLGGKSRESKETAMTIKGGGSSKINQTTNNRLLTIKRNKRGRKNKGRRRKKRKRIVCKSWSLSKEGGGCV